MPFLDFLKEVTFQAKGAGERARALAKADAGMAQLELETANAGRSPAPKPPTATSTWGAVKQAVAPPAYNPANDPLAMAELEAANGPGYQFTPSTPPPVYVPPAPVYSPPPIRERNVSYDWMAQAELDNANTGYSAPAARQVSYGWEQGQTPTAFAPLQTAQSAIDRIRERATASMFNQQMAEAELEANGRSMPEVRGINPASIPASQGMGITTGPMRSRFTPFQAFDNTVLKPLDYVAQVGSSSVPVLAQVAAGPFAPFAPQIYREIEQRLPQSGPLNLPDLPSFREGLSNTARDITNPEGAVERFRERPLMEQLVAGAIFDPTAPVPVGEVLRPLSRVVGNIPPTAFSRVAGGISEAIPDVVKTGARQFHTAEAGGGALGDVTRALFDTRPARAIGAKPELGFRVPASTVGAGVGATQGDTWEERLQNAAIGAAGGFAAPEITRAAASGIGSILEVPARVRGVQPGAVGRQTPRAVMESGESVTPLLHLPAFDSLPDNITTGENVRNGLKKLLANATGGRAGDQLSAEVINNPRIAAITDIGLWNSEQIDNLAKVYADRVDAVFREVGLETDEAGAIIVDGNRIPVFDETGAPMLGKNDEPLIGAGVADVRHAVEFNPNVYDGILTPEQVKAIESFDPVWDEMRRMFDEFDEQGDFIEGYFPRGAGGVLDQDKALSTGPMNLPSGRTPGNLKERRYKSQAAAINAGRGYGKPSEVVYDTIRRDLERINAKWASNMIEQLDAGDGFTAGASRNLPAKREYDVLRGERKEVRGRQKVLENRLARVRTQLSATDRGIESNSKRIQKLLAQTGGTPSGRADNVRESIALVEDTLKGVQAQTRDAIKAITKQVGDAGYARGRFAEGRGGAKAAAKQIEDLKATLSEIDDLSATFAADELGELGVGASKKVTDAWQKAMKLRNQVIDEMADIERRIGINDQFAEDAAKGQLALAEFREKYGRLSKYTAEGIAGMRSRARELAMATRRETELLAEGRAGTQMSGKKMSLEAKAAQLRAEIDELSQVLVPKQARIAELKQALALADEIKSSRAKWDSRSIKLAPLQGLPLPKDWIDHFNAKWVNIAPDMPKAKKAGIVYDLFNNLWRGLGATADLATYGTVQLAAAADNPGRAARIFRDGLRSAKDEGVYWQRLMEIDAWAQGNNLPSLNALLSKDFEIALPEAFLNREMGGIAGKLSEVPVIKQANRFFDTTTNLMRVIDAYDNLDALRRAGRDPFATDTIVEATTAAMINTGRAKGGVPLVSDAASGRLLFAGRFTRSQVEMVMNGVMSGAIEGDAARRILLRTAGLAAASAYLVNEAAGENWDISEPFKARVFGYDLDLAGPWSTLLKRSMAFGKELAQGDISGAGSELEAFARGKLAPVPSTALDAIGRDIGDFEVEPVQDWGKEEWIDFLPVPFTSRDLLSEGIGLDWSDPNSVAKLLFGAGINFFGIKNSPMTDYEVYVDNGDDWYKEEYEPLSYEKGKNWTFEDDPLAKATFDKTHPGVRPDPASSYGEEMYKLREDYTRDLTNLERAFYDKEELIGDFREKLKLISTEYRVGREWASKEAEDRKAKPGTPAHWAETYNGLFDKAVDPATGEFSSDLLAALQVEWANELDRKYGEGTGDTAREYIHELTLSNDTPIYRAYQDAMHTLWKGGVFDPKRLPKYLNLKGDPSEVAKHVSAVTKYDDNEFGIPSSLKGKPFALKAAWYVTNELGETNPELVRDMINAYSANQALEALKSGKAPKKGTIAFDGMRYISPEYVAFVREHKDEFAWFSENQNMTAVAPYLNEWFIENEGMTLQDYYSQQP